MYLKFLSLLFSTLIPIPPPSPISLSTIAIAKGPNSTVGKNTLNVMIPKTDSHSLHRYDVIDKCCILFLLPMVPTSASTIDLHSVLYRYFRWTVCATRWTRRIWSNTGYIQQVYYCMSLKVLHKFHIIFSKKNG